MLTSPAINIGVGRYGAECVAAIAKNFVNREKRYLDLVSFHQLDEVDGMIIKHSYILKSHDFVERTSVAQNGDEDWLLGNFLSDIYNELINLSTALITPANFGAIHINLIFSAFDNPHQKLFEKIILKADELRTQGVFGEVRIKAFVVLSAGTSLATREEEENVAKALDVLVDIKKHRDILSHIFIFDDKNTQTVSLKINPESLGFAMTEIIIALLQNEYRMLGALFSENGVFSIGMGIVFFDKLYFDAYLRMRIMDSKIKKEKLSDDGEKINIGLYLDTVNDLFRPFVSQQIALSDVIKGVMAVVDPSGFGFTLACYEFLIANLLGNHDQVKLREPINAVELYNIPDLIYQVFFNKILTPQKKEENGLLDLVSYKNKCEELLENEAKLSDDDAETISLKEELKQHETAVRNLLEEYKPKNKRNKVKTQSNEPELTRALNSMKKTREELDTEFSKKFFLTKYLSKKDHRAKIQNMDADIAKLQAQINEERVGYEKRNEEVIEQLNQLYKLWQTVEVKHREFQKYKQDLLNLQKDYRKAYEQLSFLDYEFLHNIISTDILRMYEKENREELQSGLEGILNMMYHESKEREIDFKFLLNRKIMTIVDSIVHFDITEYLNGDYTSMKLFKTFNFEKDLTLLQKRAFPFFNSIPTYTSDPHRLRYFNNINQEASDRLDKSLEDNYTASIPAFIRAESTHKFALLSIDKVEDLSAIVKYNNHTQRELKKI